MRWVLALLVVLSLVNILGTVLVLRSYRNIRLLLETWLAPEEADVPTEVEVGELASRGTMALKTLHDLQRSRDP